jgi:HD-like signal output (HDOD) protein
MIKISNSAYLGRSVKVISTQQAITRIGLRQMKNIVTALAMEQLFVSKNNVVKQYMSQIWSDTIEIVANSLAVMQIYVKETKKRTLNLESIMLAALVHNIGALPILTESERHANVFANPNFLDLSIEKMSGKLGASILTEWGFEPEFVNVAYNWKSFSVSSEAVSYLDIVRLGAALCGKFESHKDQIFNEAVEKGIISDMSELQDDEFCELRESAKQMFQ